MEGASDVDMLLAQVDDLSLLLPDDLQSAAPSAGPPAGSAMAEGKHRRTLHRQQGAHDTALESFGLALAAQLRSGRGDRSVTYEHIGRALRWHHIEASYPKV